MKSSTEGIKKNIFSHSKQNSKTIEEVIRITRLGEPRRFVASNNVSGFQGHRFIYKAGKFLTTVKMSVDWKSQNSSNMELYFSTCLIVKGTESHKSTVMQTKRYKDISSQLWSPKTSFVIKPPDLEVRGTSLTYDKKSRDMKTFDVISTSDYVFPEEQNSILANKDVATEKGDCTENKHHGENTNNGKILLTLLEASLKRKLNPEYIDIISSRLNRSSAGRKSPQFSGSSTSTFRYPPRLAIKEEILPMELKFGTRNPKINSATILRRRKNEERPKTVHSFYRGKLEPLLPREKPAENLHEELEREEARARRATPYK